MVLVRRDTPYPPWEFSDPGSGDLLRLVPERGGLVSGWRSGGRERLYLDLKRFSDPALTVRGGIPVLFPICGGLTGDTLSLSQGHFPMPQHGFARDQPWRMGPLQDGRGVVLELASCGATLAHYPFQFLLQLEVRLARGFLDIQAAVHNQGEEAMPFSFGLHPYFAIADLATARFEGLPACGLDQRTGQNCDTGQQLDLLAEGVDLLSGPAETVRLLDPSAGTALELETTAPLDLVVIWSDPPRPMACLEPWTAPRGSLATGERRLVLQPGSSQRLRTTYRVLA
jgi:galactose mutarotase-like enzyme